MQLPLVTTNLLWYGMVWYGTLPRRMVVFFAPLPLELPVNCSDLSPLWVAFTPFPVFCGDGSKFDAKGMHFAVKTTANLLLTLD